MPNALDTSFLNDIHSGFMFEEACGSGYGSLIDHLVESDKEKVHLFENAGDDPQPVKSLFDQDDMQKMMEDGDLIDQLL